MGRGYAYRWRVRTGPVRVLARAVVALGLLAVLVPASAAAEPEPLPTGTDVDYQLGGPVRRPAHVGIIARDRLARPAGVYDICYVNGFQTQPDERRFWRRHHWNLVLKDRRGRAVVDEAWGEWLLDVRTTAKRQALARIVGSWTRTCAADGFEAVEYDNLDSYTRSHRLLTRRQALAFARLLTRAAHGAGLSAGQKNAADLDGTVLGFDFAVAEECARWGECFRYVDHFGDQVVMVEYRARDFRRACENYGETHAIVLRDLALSPRYSPRYC